MREMGMERHKRPKGGCANTAIGFVQIRKRQGKGRWALWVPGQMQF